MRLRFTHNPAVLALRPAYRGRRRQTGFNFTEILFAVMILGIGFIMIAAIFPVALQQTQLTGQEVTASTAARGGMNYLQQVGLTTGGFTGTVKTTTIPGAVSATEPRIEHRSGEVFSMRDDRFADAAYRENLWKQASGNLILTSDPRVAWVGLFRRGATFTHTNTGDTPSNDPSVTVQLDASAQLWVIGVTIRNRSVYEPGKDLLRYPDAAGSPPATLEPRLVTGVAMVNSFNTPDPTAPDLITFPAADALRAVEGAYVIVADDDLPGDEITGHTYRLGTHRTDIDDFTWELAPGEDMPDGEPNAPTAEVFLVGRGYADPTDPAAGFAGPAQDVAVYTSFVPAN